MNKNILKLCQMEALKQTDFEAYQLEIAKPWHTQPADIELLTSLIAQAGAELPNSTRKLAVSFEPQTEGVDIHLPTWVFAAHEAFEKKYGSDYGGVIFEKTLAQIWDSFAPQQPIKIA